VIAEIMMYFEANEQAFKDIQQKKFMILKKKI